MDLNLISFALFLHKVNRENELTKERQSNPNCYVNFHVDITIPFDEMGSFIGIDTKNNEEHIIIYDGKFLPSVANKLNENLE